MVPKMKLVGPTSKEIRRDTNYGAGEKSKVLGISFDGTLRGREWDPGNKNGPQTDLFNSNSTSGKTGGLAMGALGSRLLGSFQDRVTSRTATKEGFWFESESLVKKNI